MSEKAHIAPEGSKDRDMLAPEDTSASKTGRGLLNVPSRSSSQKIQQSPTSTGLSGATANEPRDSIGGHSKESKGSFLGNSGRRRNGSTSSKHSNPATGPATTASNTQPNSPATTNSQQKKKSGGLLSIFGCCAVPEDAHGEDAVPATKLKDIPNRPATAKSRTATPDQTAGGNSKSQIYEKEPQPTATAQSTSDSSRTKRVSASTSQDQSTLADREAESKQAGAATETPVVTVEPPSRTMGDAGDKRTDASKERQDHDGDVEMPDVDTTSNARAKQVAADDQLPKIPPPPPGPGPAGNTAQEPIQEVPIVAEVPERKALLPAIAPHHKGRKCLVLDLDETLVHSSFKILHQADFTIPVEIEGNFHNVYVIKRPGVDEFMKRVGELYEVVVFTASVSKYGDPLLDQLDIHKVVHHRLFRESCHNHQGNYVKDLSMVGRDLKDTIIIDNSPTSYIFHPQHAVPISSWFSDAHDNELLDLIPVLEDLAGPIVRDVSLVLDVTL